MFRTGAWVAAVAGLLLLLPWPLALLLCFIGKFIVPFAAGAVVSRFLRGLVVGRVGLLRVSDVGASLGQLARLSVDSVEVKFAVVQGRRLPAPSLHIGKVVVAVSLPALPSRASVGPVEPATVEGVSGGSSGRGTAPQQPTPAGGRFMGGLPPPLPPPPGMDMAGRGSAPSVRWIVHGCGRGPLGWIVGCTCNASTGWTAGVTGRRMGTSLNTSCVLQAPPPPLWRAQGDLGVSMQQ
jgi:hypothetical protein